MRPIDRFGLPIALLPALTRLTSIDQQAITTSRIALFDALLAFDMFTGGAPIWSWGKDELNLMAISTWIAGMPSPIPAPRFGNPCSLLLQAGVPLDEVIALRSHTLCAHFGLSAPTGQAHNARSVAVVLQHLLATGLLFADNLRNTAP